MKFYLIVFNNRNYALAVQSIMKNKGIKDILAISLPCKIKSGCDLCIKTHDLENVKLIINECKDKYKINKIFSGNKVNGIYVYRLLNFES